MHIADRVLISKEPAMTMQECVDANASIPCQAGKYSLSDRKVFPVRQESIPCQAGKYSLSDREDLGYKL